MIMPNTLSVKYFHEYPGKKTKKICFHHKNMVYIYFKTNKIEWGCSAVGSASEWHSEGRGFDSHQLHIFSLNEDKKKKRARQVKPGCI